MKTKKQVSPGSLTVLLALLMIGSADIHAQTVNPEFSIVSDPSPGISVLHGLDKLMDALQTKSISYEKVTSLEKANGKTVFLAGLAYGNGAAAKLVKKENRSVPEIPEALSIWKTTRQEKPIWVINGFDDRGLMYALLNVADVVNHCPKGISPLDQLKEVTEQPDVNTRAVSVYTMNRAYWESRFYDESYWEKYLDMLAQNRFNNFTIIFGYENGGFLAPPYPYFFDVAEYPGVKMQGITPNEQQRNLDALNHLIEMAHDRGIEVTLGIWDHIYRGGVQGGGIPGKQEAPAVPEEGLVWGLKEDNLIPYTKTALKEFISRVPDLDGLQFRMHDESGLKEGEQLGFWTDIFRMMKETTPDLHLDLRAKNLPEEVIQSALDIGVNFRIATKFWMEQMGMPYHPTQINPERSPIRHSYAHLLKYPQQYHMLWRMWNGGTTRILLWGSPDYARRFAESTHLYGGDGFEINEPLATKMEAQPHDAVPFDLLNPSYSYYQYEFERYWHFFQVFGRIGYNPETLPEVWDREFESRFGPDAGPLMEEALHKASWILPRIITSVYPYSKFPTTRGWAEKQRLGDLPAYATNQGSDLMQFANFDEEAQLLIDGGETAKILPSENGFWFARTAAEIDDLVNQAEKAIGNNRNKEFNSTVVDLKILSNLALFHSHRIPAAVNYKLFERTNDVSALDQAIFHERLAINAWEQLVEAAGDVYADNLMMGVCIHDLCGHWKEELIGLKKGLADLENRYQELKNKETTSKTAPSYMPGAGTPFEELFHVHHQQFTGLSAGVPVKVEIEVTGPAGIKWVHLRYRSVNQELEYKSLPMLPAEGSNVYTATIPVAEIDPSYDLMYLIEMMDQEGHGRIYPDLNHETPYLFINFKR